MFLWLLKDSHRTTVVERLGIRTKKMAEHLLADVPTQDLEKTWDATTVRISRSDPDHLARNAQEAVKAVLKGS